MSDPSDATTESPETSQSAGSVLVSILLGAALLGGAAALAYVIFSTEPTAQRGGATKKTAMRVEVIEARRETHRPQLRAVGTVAPERDIVLRPQIGGPIVEISERFVPGGFIEEGETLMRIQPADYRNTLDQREAALDQMRAELELEQGSQDVARADYEIFAEDLPEAKQELVLRKPQLKSAEARVDAAEAAVKQARLDLRRTRIKAPFAAHVLRRDVNLGSQVNPGVSLGRLVGLETYWVQVELPLDRLRWVEIPSEEGEVGSEVRVRNRVAWPEDVFRVGHIDGLIGSLDGGTRMARLLVTIADPMARSEAKGEPPLMVGEFVEAHIQGTSLEAIRLDRRYVRDGPTVWTMEEGKLRVKPVEVAVEDAQYAYITGGLEDGAKIVTTSLATVVDGAALRLKSEDGGEDEAEEGADE